jgi:phosphoribosyl 1,2-cyclic phosphodiesterase
VGFIFDDGDRRLGILTDLGHVFAGLAQTLLSLDAVLLESNYDPTMLEQGPYPEFLKQRIRGPGGHLSNHESARLLSAAFQGRLKWACLAHLSQHNNHPALALETHQAMVGPHHRLVVASRYAASPLFEV